MLDRWTWHHKGLESFADGHGSAIVTGSLQGVAVKEPEQSVSEMVDGLFCERWPEGYKMATVEVADFVSTRIGRDVDRQYIYRIRTGKVRKVDARILDAIAEFFGKPLDYFSAREAAADINGDDALARAQRETELQLVGLRSREITPEAREELARLIRMARDVIDGDTATSRTAS